MIEGGDEVRHVAFKPHFSSVISDSLNHLALQGHVA